MQKCNHLVACSLLAYDFQHLKNFKETVILNKYLPQVWVLHDCSSLSVPPELSNAAESKEHVRVRKMMPPEPHAFEQDDQDAQSLKIGFRFLIIKFILKSIFTLTHQK